VKQREASIEAWDRIWSSKTNLKKLRNWTDGSIAEFLGEPDRVTTNRFGKVRRSYSRKRVAAVEGTANFYQWMNKRVSGQMKKGSCHYFEDGSLAAKLISTHKPYH
jgi:hypothetical protein